MARILLADDSANVRELLRYCLLGAGHTVLEAADGRAALLLAGAAAVDLFVCDLFMPDVDGIQAIREFRRTFPGVPIIAVSGGGRPELMDILAMAQRLGADRVLSKPFEHSELLGLVGELLAGKSGRCQLPRNHSHTSGS